MMSAFPYGSPDLPSWEDAARDIEVMLTSLGLQSIRRYLGQHHWEKESQSALAADEAEPGLKLENVAAHSWQVADATMLLAPTFPEINPQRALELAIVHDKLELFTGDFDPVGSDGQGTYSHAFNGRAQTHKTALELAALERYVAQLRGPARDLQRSLILETIRASSAEALFVKAVDKLQALSFVLVKKAGQMTDEHLAFSLRYSAKAVDYFPQLRVHHAVLCSRLVTGIANVRHVRVEEVLEAIPPALRALATPDEQ
tara:strand:- start:37192 stop:37965 length:774 start_codon:yes stop_codon:yes gene_type:complete